MSLGTVLSMARRHARSLLLLLVCVILLATIDNVACGQSSAEQSIKCADVNVEVVSIWASVCVFVKCVDHVCKGL